MSAPTHAVDQLDAIVHKLHATLRRDGRYHADCPICGKQEKRNQKHFSFCEAGYFCYVCGAKGGLVALAKHLDIHGAAAASQPRQRTQEPPKPRQWQHNPTRYLDDYCGAPTRLQDWQGYKPLSIDTIATYRLGIGILPASRCQHRRLVLPVYHQGQIVAFHGRAYRSGDDDAKWLCAGGSRKDVLFNADALRPGATVIICENFVDCLLAQEADNVIAVAGGGVSWRDEWTQQIAASRPRHVLVWLDNDLVGNPNTSTYRSLMAQWRREMHARVQQGKIPTIPQPPQPKGPQIANDLLAAGMKASVYRWPNDTPPKADIGWALTRAALSTSAINS